MNKEIIENLEKEISRLLGTLAGLEPGTDDYDGVIEAINKLYTTINKEETIDIESSRIEAEIYKTDRSLDVEKINARDNRVLGIVKTGVELAGIIIPIAFYGIWMSRGLEFEKEGSFTSNTFKGLIGKFKPTK